MRAHSDIKKILIFEKHDEFLRRASPSSASPALRSGSRCFFTCILRHFFFFFFYPHSTARERNTHRTAVRMKTHTPRFTLPPPPPSTRSRRHGRGGPQVRAIHGAALTPDGLRDAHPNSAGLRRSSASQHWLPVANT